VAFESHGIVNNANNDFLAAYSESKQNTPIVQEEAKSESDQQQLSSEDVMKMRIDPSKVTSEDIELYEKMMLGAVTLARSNANHKVGRASDTNVDVFAKHTWTRDASTSENIGALEMQFENPTSLVNLKVAINFASSDFESIAKGLTEGNS
jgi:hypothetical protein